MFSFHSSVSRAVRRTRHFLVFAGVAALMAVPAAHAATPYASTSPAAASGWRLSFSDDFNGTSLNRANWCVYNGSGNQHGPRSARHVFVRNGVLTLRTQPIGGQWHGAGVCAARATRQTYGKYEMRVRMDQGFGVRGTALLWPVAGWPPEIDFFELESSNAARTRNMLSNHYGSTNSMQHAFVPGTYSAWHNVGVEWTRSAIRYTLDGRVVATMTGHVPHQQMWLAIQTGTGKAGGPNAPRASTPRPVDLQVDWVRVYQVG